MDTIRLQRDVADVGPDIVGTIAGFPVANSFLLSLVIVILFAIVSYWITKRFKLVPTRLQNMMESLYEGMLKLTDQITNSKRLSARIFPLIAALFVYIGVANMIGLIPGMTSFTWDGQALFRTPTSDFNTTFGLAFAMILLIQVDSIREWGILGYLGRFFKFKEVYQGFRKGIKNGFLALVDFFIGLMDVIAEIAKIISLSFRLFGNMFAGEVLMVLLLGAVAFVVPALWFSLNLLFALVQAVVFGALTAAYYTLAMKHEEAEETVEADELN